jgi:hypothetical protein
MSDIFTWYCEVSESRVSWWEEYWFIEQVNHAVLQVSAWKVVY